MDALPNEIAQNPILKIMAVHEGNTGHEDFQILNIGKKPHVKCKECNKIIWQ